ncbi:hypothetical protein ACH5Y9_08665 [Methylomonas sp. BW4-1]|uniref:hypothetical protein n=1 Tax=Methylomonas sp. BW4-1 TaxID=3376685 RepID=UPI0040432E2B
MATPETIFGLTSADISLVSAFISLVSVYVAIRLAWNTRFSPPSLVGAFPYAILWTFFEKTNGEPNGFFLVPFFWLSNTGVRSMLVADLRLIVSPLNGETFTLFPIHSIPTEAVESPNTFSDHELLRIGDAPFGGFAISNSEKWTNHHALSLSPEQRASLKGKVKFTVQIKRVGAKRFEKAISQKIGFDVSSFDWLTWAGVGGPSAHYYYSEELRQRK